MIQGLGFKFKGSGFKIQDLGFRAYIGYGVLG
jgi:predicted nucleic acid-binding Zn ribbon protein